MPLVVNRFLKGKGRKAVKAEKTCVIFIAAALSVQDKFF
jgi:hypothetical protein